MIKKFVLFTTLLFLTPFSFAQKITMQGADTLILLGQRLSQLYKRHDPNAAFTIKGGGSAPAFASLGSGIDIVQDTGVTAKRPLQIAVGIQGIALYVNKNNPVSELTISQVRSIFLGEITNWKTLGGRDEPILLFAGESTTGTLDYFQTAILKGREPYPFVGKANSKDLVDTVAATPNAMGYASLRYSTEVKAIAIKVGPSSMAVMPTIDSVRDRSYPISRYVYWTFAKKPAGDLAEFCGWVMSSEGQTVVESVGFEPLLPRDRSRAIATLGLSTTEVAQAK